ncbi:hypothetical protein BU23DRAFT_541314 [Bimuria novae-zelandiae CBS 107.79]|uniref:Fumarylacetoacetate hydrolase-like protein n=1 Tax=Bimuria novae-zelandiae CBS 107.79 TaxID=1447943 RepID=A0A6A5UVD0_9PLEO|nr:hypothetical protein BU23DRAFT_541314 [Bimuria novae-zelandiae CBS 107.79]
MSEVTSAQFAPAPNVSSSDPFTNYVSFQDPETGEACIGHYDLGSETIQPLTFSSGTPVSNLYQVIEAQTIHESNPGSHIVKSGESRPASSVKILPPLTGRDVLCVGKNYAEHAKEFNSSGFDSSDKVDQPSHPVIFTKRYTSIIAHGEEILPHEEFTKTADYEGEIGVIVGKAGFRIAERDAIEHVWGYTIINDVTARERQRDHKQFYIGKSPDTFCPMVCCYLGPIAVPASKLEKVLRVQTRVNGELRQDATTDDLIFSIPYLIKTMSEGQTLMPGDVLATGTPAGVGFGQKPPVYLKPGDTVSVTVTGLGTLENRIADPTTRNLSLERNESMTTSHFANASILPGFKSLVTINEKPMYYRAMGKLDGSPIVFVHGLGATNEYFAPLISALKLSEKYKIHLYDFEGHGLSPTHPLSKISVESLASDLNGIFEYTNITSSATLIADGLGCLIALQFVKAHPGKVSKLVLLSPPPVPLPDALSKRLSERARRARRFGMAAVVDSAASSVAEDSLTTLNPLALAARSISLLGQDPQGYAKACMALAGAAGTVRIATKPKILTVGTPGTLQSGLVFGGVLDGDEWTRKEGPGGHWSVFQDLDGVTEAVKGFL